MGDSVNEDPPAGLTGRRELRRAVEVIELLSETCGPRRPGSASEARAAAEVVRIAEGFGASVRVESFRTVSSFGHVFGPVLALCALPALLPRRWSRLRAATPLLGVALGALEDGLVAPVLSRLLARRPSANVIARVEPRGEALRTACLVCHLDSSRSGAMFREPILSRLRLLIRGGSVACVLSAASPLVARLPGGERLVALARAFLGLELALVVERELAGEDVPGANDNASGVGTALALLERAAREPLESTSVAVVATGAEEAGTVGAIELMRRHGHRDWLYLNLDGVCAPATLRYLREEGVVRRWGADPGLLRVVEGLARRRPQLGLEAAGARAGLTYDATPVMARGGRALTLSAQDDTIPRYHAPDDRLPDNLDRDVLARALEAAAELLFAIDRGEADR